MTLTNRSVLKLRDDGYCAQVVERWNAFTKTRHDLFGCIDIIAIGQGKTLAVQTTSKTNMNARIKKIENNEYLNEMIRANWCILVHGWYKEKNRWRCKEFEF
jgi:hypothetical protein